MWIKQVFGTTRPVIGMVHLKALPGTPLYDSEAGVDGILQGARRDLEALIDGGIDAVMFCNENDRPYTISVGSEQVAMMAAVIGALKSRISVPFGVDILWDAEAAISIAHATGAAFVREVLTGVYSSDMGLWTPDAGKALRHRRAIGADNVKVLFNINAEFASPLGTRDTVAIAQSVAFGSIPDGICVSGAMTGTEVDQSVLGQVKRVVGDVPVFVNTGVRADNAARYLSVADAAIVGTSLKRDAVTWNPVDGQRVKTLMEVVRGCR
jgi:uncharacterized protein